MRRAVVVLAAVAASAVVLELVLRGGGDAEGKQGALVAPRLAPAPAPGLKIGRPVPLAAGRHETRWAPVRTATVARSRPEPGAPRVARLSRRTPEGTTNIVVALARAKDADGGLWVRVRLPVLPNGTTGWVRRRALGGYGTVTTQLWVDRRRLQAVLTRDGRPVFRAPVGIGTADAPTPRGEFYVRNELTGFRDPTYGPLAFGTSARSETLTDWPDGGYVGIHGTDEPELLPGRVSHGCIRLRNRDIVRLARLMPVGTPLTVR